MPEGTVLVTWVDFDPDDPRTGRRLREAGLELRLAPKVGGRTPRELTTLLDGAAAAIVSTDPFDRGVLDAARDLRVVARVGVGTDSVDLAAASREGVVVTVTPGANSETAADHTLALILGALRRLVEHDASVRRGEWRRGGDLTGWDLHGSIVGLVGYGEIGRAVARRLRGFDVRVLVADPALAPAAAGSGAGLDGEPVPLETLLGRADVVSLHLPLTSATRGLIGAAALAAMRPQAILVNTSRGGVVDEPALVDALRASRLRGAALDVFADEPTVPAALLELPGVLLTPHVGGLSVRSIERMTEQATDSVLAVLTGRALDPRRVANPAVLAERSLA